MKINKILIIICVVAVMLSLYGCKSDKDREREYESCKRNYQQEHYAALNVFYDYMEYRFWYYVKPGLRSDYNKQFFVPCKGSVGDCSLLQGENPYINNYQDPYNCGQDAIVKFMNAVSPYLDYDKYDSEISNTSEYFSEIFCAYFKQNSCENLKP